MKAALFVALLAAAAASPTRAAAVADGRAALTTALERFLEDHGRLCLGKTSWPILVSDADRAVPTSDALQLPVLERLGLVASGAAEAGGARRYQLTTEGRRYYLRQSRRPRSPEEPASRDLCAGRILLREIVNVDGDGDRSGGRVLVRYTYRLAAFDWMQSPEARRVFPLVNQLMIGQATTTLEQRFQRREGRWVPLDPRN